MKGPPASLGAARAIGFRAVRLHGRAERLVNIERDCARPVARSMSGAEPNRRPPVAVGDDVLPAILIEKILVHRSPFQKAGLNAVMLRAESLK